MFILIGEENKKMINFKKSLTDSAVLLNMPCELANIPKDATIMIPFSRVLDNGVIEGTKFFIEEILLAPKVKRIVFEISIIKRCLKIMFGFPCRLPV